MEISDKINAAKATHPIDLVLQNGKFIDVFSGQIVEKDIAIHNGYIVGFGQYKAYKSIDLKGMFISPGFIDPHLHIESSMCCVTEFARAILKCGTTTVVADPHEIANVMGIKGLEYMLQSSQNQPIDIYYTLPSCVPATHMETSGANLDADTIEQFLNNEKIVGLAEMMNYPGVIYTSLDVIKKIEKSLLYSKPIDGHAPGITDKDLYAYIAAGITSDHECTTPKEAKEKIESGMHIMIREGTGAKNLESLISIVTPKTFHRIMWCTDDRHPHDILDQGHINFIVKKAIELGIDPIMAIQIATINPAQYFGLKDVGAIAPGKKANLIIFSELNKLNIKQIYTNGMLSVDQDNISTNIKKSDSPPCTQTINCPIDKINFSVKAKKNRIKVIEIIPDQILTKQIIMDATVLDGKIVSDISRDIIKIAVIERYTGNAGMGIGFVKGFGLKKGALASSVCHDSHNIIVIGTNDNDMQIAVNQIINMQGGLAVVSDKQVKASLALPIAGLMSYESCDNIRTLMDQLISTSYSLGVKLKDPFMTLSFLALPVIPELKITDKGLVDVIQFKPVSLFIE